MLNALTNKLFRERFSRYLATKAKKKIVEKPHPKAKRIKELQRKFTVDDGVPVYLKAGSRDKLLFQVSLGGLAIGIVMALDVFYRLIVPGKKPGFEGAAAHEDDY